jgi:hypothetical protein
MRWDDYWGSAVMEENAFSRKGNKRGENCPSCFDEAAPEARRVMAPNRSANAADLVWGRQSMWRFQFGDALREGLGFEVERPERQAGRLDSHFERARPFMELRKERGFHTFYVGAELRQFGGDPVSVLVGQAHGSFRL